MVLNDNIKYILSNEVRFRREKNRCVFYTVDDFFHSPDNISIIHPYDVIFLLLFDGTRTLKDIERDFNYLFNINDCNARRILEKLVPQLHNIDLVVPVNTYSAEIIDTIRNRYEATSFVIPADEIFLDQKNLRLDSPLSVNYNVTTHCGFSCKYCYHPLMPIKDYIPLSRLEILFKDLKKTGCESILLTGGDPLLRHDIDEMMILLKKTDLFYTLSTKSILSSDRIRKLYNEAGLDRVQLSIDCFDPNIEHELIGVDFDYVDKFVKMTKFMKFIGLDVRFKAVLTSYNADYFEKYLKMCEELDIKHIQIVSYGRSGYRHSDSLFANERQMNVVSDILDKWRSVHSDVTLVGGNFTPAFVSHEKENAYSLNDMMGKRVVCNAGRFSLQLMPNGEAFVCEHLPYCKDYILGDFSTSNLYEVWNGIDMMNWLSPPPRETFPSDSPCHDCSDEYYKVCHSSYSRCLRFCREYMGATTSPDYHCPMSNYKEIRII